MPLSPKNSRIETLKKPGTDHLTVLRVLVALVLPFGLEAGFKGSEIQVADGFEVELLYEVDPESQGSWVALCVDHRGRLIAGDQYGGLYRVDLGGDLPLSVEKIGLEIGHVNGLTYAFDSLYAVVAEDKYQGGGLYRIRDMDGDDEYDEVEYLRDFVAKGEHGPHSVIPGPDGKWLYVVSGNKTPVPEGPGFSTLVPDHWGEDDLLPRLWGPIGSEKGTTAPGGWIARTDAEGKTWQLVAIGFRNAFDLAFNREGELFTADADAEFDMGTPWYQPTRLLHVVAGTDYGWRSGAGKWPPYFADTIPPVYEFGPGSPTGVTFGYGTRFPEEYQEAIFTCDWSWGRVFVTWLTEEGASYRGRTEEFLSGIPLPIADLVVNPFDGALYFVLGGRGTRSGLYRVSYVGTPHSEIMTPVVSRERVVSEETPVWENLGGSDPVLRHRARIFLENTHLSQWLEEAEAESNPVRKMMAFLALGRAGRPEHLPIILEGLLDLDWSAFTEEEELIALRCLEVAFMRMGSSHTNVPVVRKLLEDRFPRKETILNTELLKLLVYLKSAQATAPAMDLLQAAATHEDMLRYLVPLRLQTMGWTGGLRQTFFKLLAQARSWKGGRSLQAYVEMIVEDALQSLPETERSFYRNFLESSSRLKAAETMEARSFVRNWDLDDLLPGSETETGSRDIENGRQAFTAAGCFACHRVNGEGGGIGPDLSAALRRFSVRDFLEAVIEPSKIISDQYGMSVIKKSDGTEIHGKVVNYYGDSIGIQTNSLDAANISRIPRKDIVSLDQSPVSPMPPGLLSTLTREDILDMLAFLSEAGGFPE